VINTENGKFTGDKLAITLIDFQYSKKLW